MIIARTIEFDAGHRVPNHESKCRNPHGHRYKVRVHVEGHLIEKKGASDEGMVMDFGTLKQVMMDVIHDTFDHGFMVYEGDDALMKLVSGAEDEEWKIIVMGRIPTAENIAISIWELLEKAGVRGLHSVDVWETPTCLATYMGKSHGRSYRRTYA